MAFSMESSMSTVFKSSTQIFVTDKDKEIVEAVLIEADGRKFYTGLDGAAYLDLKPGKYSVRLSKISYDDAEYEISVSDRASFIKLSIGNN